VVETFHHVLKALGIPETPGRPRPRLMDFRHTFAVRALERCPPRRPIARAASRAERLA
jgi:hypothetical protein